MHAARVGVTCTALHAVNYAAHAHDNPAHAQAMTAAVRTGHVGRQIDGAPLSF